MARTPRWLARFPLVATGLATTVVMFLMAQMLDLQAIRRFDQLRSDMASKGGGVFIVMQPPDCIVDGEVARRIGWALQEREVPLLGLVLEDGFHESIVQSALEIGNTRFPHVATGSRAVSSLARVTGVVSTPFALAINVRGQITKVLALAGLNSSSIPASVEQLAKPSGEIGQ